MPCLMDISSKVCHQPISQCYYTVHHLHNYSALMATENAPASAPRDYLQSSIRTLTASVTALSKEQQQLKATLKEQPPQHGWGWKPQSPSSNAPQDRLSYVPDVQFYTKMWTSKTLCAVLERGYAKYIVYLLRENLD